MTIQVYAVYRTAAYNSEPVGYVINRIIWDGVTSYSPGDGLALVDDPDGQYPIGSTYAASAS